MADRSKQDAGAQFAKLQREKDAKKAMSDYETEAAAMRAKTERLRALRLARDAAAPPPAPTAPKRKGSKSKKKGSDGTLAAWLDGQSKEGRNS